jgi:WD40 repeat protein
MTVRDTLLAMNPFPGLRPFATDESDRFFGRQQQIDDVIARLYDVQFVAVTGSSGCGKSSLVRAGVISELQRQSAAGRGPEWRIAVLRPGNQPIASLAEQVANVVNSGDVSGDLRTGALYGRLRLGGLALAEVATSPTVHAGTRLLVVVDQFEELFRFQRMADPEEASAFVKLLLNASRDAQSPVSVIITLRSDSLGFCADFRGLPEMINRGQYLVPKLTREERKEAIVNPVELRGFTIAPRLVQRLLSDVSDNFDDLPIMQHVMTRTWNQWVDAANGGRPIDLEDYEAVGTAQRALSQHAGEAYDSLTGLAPVIEKVFRAITERTDDGRDIRRPLDFDRLCGIVGADFDAVARVVDRFRRPDTAFLMPPEEVPLSGNPVIDISHESLIRQWERLKEWARVEAESRTRLVRLVEAARAYGGRPEGLWQGPGLQKALEWEKSTQPTPAWVGLYFPENESETWDAARKFLLDSAALARTQGRRMKRLVRVQSAFAILVVISLVAVFEMTHQQRQTMSREFASRALLDVNREPARAAQFALAAFDLDPSNVQAANALSQELVNLDVARTDTVLTLGGPVMDVRYTRDGSRFVAASGKRVMVFDARTFTTIGQPTLYDASITRVWLVADNTTLVTQTEDGRAQIQRIGEQTVHRLRCTREGDAAFLVAVGADERHVALGCYGGEVRVWRLTELDRQPLILASTNSTITALAFTPHGEYLASGDADGRVNIWDIATGRLWLPSTPAAAVGAFAIRHASAIRDIAFHPTDSDLLATAADDNLAIVWQLDLQHARVVPDKMNARTPKRWVFNHRRPVVFAKFVPTRDASPLLTISDKTAWMWTSQNAESRAMRGHDDWVLDANSSADGGLIVTASSDATARVWSTQSGTPLAVLRGHRSQVSRALISPDGAHIVTASLDGTIRIWTFAAPNLLETTNGWMLSAAFEPHGSRIAVAGERRANWLDRVDNGPDASNVHDLPQKLIADAISNMSWSRDARLLLGIRSGQGISTNIHPILWNATTGAELTPTWLDASRWAAFSLDSDELLSIDREGALAVSRVDVDTIARQPRPEGPPFGRGYYMAAISPNGRWVAAVSWDSYTVVALWDRNHLENGARLLTRHQGDLSSLRFSRDSNWLVTASRDRTAVIWSVNSSDAPKVLSGGHTAALSWASFDPTGKYVATASADHTIRVWDTSPPNQLAVLRWHSDAVNEVEFSQDGQWILSASDDGTVKMGRCMPCNVSPADARARVERLAYLPDEELAAVRREIDGQQRYFSWPAFLSRRP